MATISICAIVKNEENRIQQFLDSICGFADEIVIVDNMSTDKTAEIVKEYGVKLYQSEESFDLSRNVYFEKANCDWIFTLDTDEFIFEDDYNKLKEKLQTVDNEVMCGLVGCNNYYGEGQWSTWFLPRLIRNNKKVGIKTAIHGSVIDSVEKANGKLVWTEMTIHHYDAIINKNQKNKRLRNISYIKQELSKPNCDINLYVNLACELFAMGDKIEALKTIRYACSVLTDNASKAYRYYASIAYYCGNYEESIKAIDEQIIKYKKSIELNEVRAPRSLLELDLCNVIKMKNYVALNRNVEAMELCRENIDNNEILAHNYINAFILSEYKEFEFLKQAIERNGLLGLNDIYTPTTEYNLYSLSGVLLSNNWIRYIDKMDL